MSLISPTDMKQQVEITRRFDKKRYAPNALDYLLYVISTIRIRLIKASEKFDRMLAGARWKVQKHRARQKDFARIKQNEQSATR